MVAPLRFKNIAHQAVAPTLILIITEVEAPKYRYLTWVRRHGLEERPEEHYEYDMINYQ